MHAVWLPRRTKPFGTIVLLAAHTPHNVHTKFHSADICDILSMNIWAINVVLNVKFRKPSSPSPYALLRMRVCRKPRYDVQILSCVDILPVRNNSEACGDVYRWCMPSSELDRNCVSRGRHTHTHIVIVVDARLHHQNCLDILRCSRLQHCSCFRKHCSVAPRQCVRIIFISLGIYM